MGKIIFIFGAIFILPLVGLFAFVMMRAGGRKKARIAPWTELAGKWGGQYANDMVRCVGESGELSLRVDLVSVLQSRSSPYYDDGGTFTLATLSSRHPISQEGPVRAGKLMSFDDLTVMDGLPGTVMDVAHGGGAVFVEPQAVTIVFDGSETEVAKLDAAFRALDAFSRYTLANGPLQMIG